MKIGIFTHEFPIKKPFHIEGEYKWGGVAEVIYELVMRINESGNKIIIFTLSPTAEHIEQKYQNIKVIRYGIDYNYGGVKLSYNYILNPLNYDLDLIHIHKGRPQGVLAGYVYQKFKKKPSILTHACHFFSTPGGSYSAPQGRAARSRIRSSTKIFAKTDIHRPVSHDLKGRGIRAYA